MSASDLAGVRIREARKAKGWRVRDLADHCAKAGAGYITATVITNLETRRRATREITVDELLALAYVLEVPPVLLMSPMSQGEELEIVPDVTKDPLEAAAWISAETAMLGPVSRAGNPRPEETERVLRWRTDALTVLRQIRYIADKIRRYHRELGNAAALERWPHTAEWDEKGIAVLGPRLLHLLASLQTLGYEPPDIPDVMQILGERGIPATLREWQDEAGEVDGDGEM